ncbi:MAG: 30S ribosomal protein S5 [Candidatus Falkowbacteria bacterium]
MSEEKKQTSEVREAAVAGAVAKTIYGGNTNANRGGQGGQQRGGQGGQQRGGQRGGGRFEKKDEMEQRILDIARVTRVMKGGKRMSFRACVALGDKKGNIGTGLGKGADVTMAVNKAVNQAKKHMITVNMVNDTIPHEVRKIIGASSIMFKPAQKGRGVIAGGVVRVILELAGVKNVTSKILGTNNKINNARCTIEALNSLRKVEKKVKVVKPVEKEEKKVVK